MCLAKLFAAFLKLAVPLGAWITLALLLAGRFIARFSCQNSGGLRVVKDEVRQWQRLHLETGSLQHSGIHIHVSASNDPSTVSSLRRPKLKSVEEAGTHIVAQFLQLSANNFIPRPRRGQLVTGGKYY